MKFTDKLEVQHLQVGMYIAKLDRPWLETPFPFQGFYLRTKHEINEVQRFCEFVFVDGKKGTQPYKESEIGKPSPLLAEENKRKSRFVSAADLKNIVIDIGK